MAEGTREKVEALQAELAEKVGALTTGEDWQRYLDVASKFHRYSPNNTMLIWMQSPDATQVAGYQRWRELGRQVRKGERGIAILAPVVRKVEDDETGEELRRVVGFKTAHVFDIAQTDGDELPEHPCHRLTGEGPAGAWEAIASLLAAERAQVVRGPLLGGANGQTRWGEVVTVIVRDDLTPAQACKTLAHELAHVLMHRPEGLAAFACRDAKEVEAESVAYVVMQTLGLDTSGYSLGYVASWSGGDPKAVQATAERVVSTATRILDRLGELPSEVEQAA